MTFPRPEDRTLKDWALALKIRSERLHKMLDLPIPPLILINEYDLLQQSMEGIRIKLSELEKEQA